MRRPVEAANWTKRNATDKEPLTCNCKDDANRKVDNGELSQALSRSQTITGRASESMVQQALDRRSLRGRFVDGGEVRDCLSVAGWSQNHIDFLLNRSQYEHEKELGPSE